MLGVIACCDEPSSCGCDPMVTPPSVTARSAAADATFATTTNLGSYTANTIGGSGNVGGLVFTFTPASARYVRMQITSNYGAGIGTLFGEAAFEVQTAAAPAAVPAPSSLTLLGLGTLTLAGAGWRQRRTAR